MRPRAIFGWLVASLLILCLLPLPIMADCSGLLANAGFEGGAYKSETLGTSLSSNVSEGWVPWSILGGATYNREVEYKVIDAVELGEPYRVHGGRRAQKFFTTWGTHTAGFYQRVQVVPGSKVTFSIWAQIYTGEREIVSDGQFISDLEWPTEDDKKKGPGLYRIYVGIDPNGDTPASFGAPPSQNTVWSEPVTDHETRVQDASGAPHDAWVELSVTTVARGNFVTVYTKGQPEYPVKHNDSFWDDACLTVQRPPTATPRPTEPPTATPIPTETSLPSVTPTSSPTDTVTLTATSVPTETPPPPTVTTVPPTATPTTLNMASVIAELQNDPPPESDPAAGGAAYLQALAQRLGDESELTLIYAGVALMVIIAVAWLRLSKG